MSFSGWGTGSPSPARPTSSLPLGGSVGYGGWSAGFQGMASNPSASQHQQQDEAQFNALFPIGGFVTGEQVKSVFEASKLPSAKLAQIWGAVDKDRDGKINKTEFCNAMSMIRQAQQFTSFGSQSNFPPSQSSFPAGSGNMSKSWSVTSGVTPQGSASGSVGVAGWAKKTTPPTNASVGVASHGWAITPPDMRRYVSEFNNLDVNLSGFLSGLQVRDILSKSGLGKMVLAKIWELSDIDKDGRLSCDEYAIAMHLMTKVRGGASLPGNLPPELYPGPTKYHTMDRPITTAGKPPMEKKTSQPLIGEGTQTPSSGTSGGGGHTRNPSGGGHTRNPSGGGHTRNPSGGGHTRNSSGGGDGFTFEDKRKENFEAGRMELERRRKFIKEQQEKEAAEKERKRREEEERRLQQERDAELARQAELERQRRKAMEIEQERERQRQKLAQQREAEQRELERKRKEEWSRKRCVELEGQRDWEKKSLHSLRVQHSQLEDQLRQLDQKKLSVQASTQRQQAMFSQIILDLKSMRVSHDVRRAELSKLQSQLNGCHTQLASLQRERRELRESLQGQSPEMALYQQQRQQLKDKIMGLAASLAGLRANITHNTNTMQDLTDTFKTNSQLLADLKKTCQADDISVSELRQKVLTQQESFEEAQRIQREEAELRAEEERRERREREEEELREKRERERLRKEVEDRANREARLEKIKKDQEVAIRNAKLQSAMAKSTASAVPMPISKPTPPKKPSHLEKTPPPAVEKDGGWTMEDEQVKKKVQELQKRKAALQKEREKSKATSSKPTPHASEGKGKPKPVKQPDLAEKGKARGKKGKVQEKVKAEQQLLDLNSSWDSTAQTSPGISSFAKDTSQILQPLKPVDEEGEEQEQSTKSPLPWKPVPKPRSASMSPEPHESQDTEPSIKRFSVARLSELFDKGMSTTSPGWSSQIQSESKPKSPQQTANSANQDYINVDQIISPGGTAPNPMTPNSASQASDYINYDEFASPEGPISDSANSASQVTMATGEGCGYRVLYSYQATDDTEVSVEEGDEVTFVPREDASTGWSMVRLSGGEQGWVPESYLQPLPKGGVVATDVGDVSQATGQIMPEDPQTPSLTPQPMQAKVLFSWKGSKDNHLSLVEGEVIQVLQQSEKWWSGQLEDKVGWFPKTFVKVLDTSPQSSSPAPPPSQATPTNTTCDSAGGMYEAIYEYAGEADGDLTFQAGDTIEVTSCDGQWWTGVLNGVAGTFPSNYVKPKQTQSSESPQAGPVSPVNSIPLPPPSPQTPMTPMTPKPAIARVVVAYQSTKQGQLTLSNGQLVKVLKQADNGWWEGEVQSRGKQREVGWFPANRVQLLPQRRPSADSACSSPSHNKDSRSSLSDIRVARAKSPFLEVLEPTKTSPVNLVLALYTYTAQSADELSFHKGSVITVLGKEGEWWRGEVNDKTGLFPSNYVQPLTDQQPSASEPTRWADSVSPEVLASVSDKERKRQEAIFELLTSERHYVDSLKLVKEVFFDPMAADEVLTEEEMARVMVNWDELIRCSSELLSAFLVRLRTSGEMVRGVGDVLASQIPKLTPHIRWCSCQLNACLLLQQKSSDPKMKEFEQKCSSDPRTGGLPLSSFLLKPMQRVTKYPLLVKRIMDYTTSPDNDYTDLKAALSEAKILCDQVNDGVRQKENTEQLEWLQANVTFTLLEEKLVFNSQTNFMGSRKLLHWGKFFKIRGSKDLVGFLFNDFLMLVRPKLFFPKAATSAELEPWGKNEFQMYRKPYLLDALQAKKAGSDASGAMLSLHQASSEEKDVLLRVDSEKARDQWIQKLTKASLDFITTKKRMEREKREQYMRTMRDSVGKLEVTVVKGVDLLAKDPNGKSDPFCVIRLGDQQEQTTPVIHNSLNPKWNCTMKFAVHDINKDTMDITVFDKDLFSPNDFLGSGRVSLKDLLRDKDSPWEKTVLLENATSGEIYLKISLTINKSDLLL